MEFDWTGWTDWHKWPEIDFRKIEDKPGAYVIATRVPISRFVGTDPEGFIDVGETGTLRTRLRAFTRCASKETYGHMAGVRYFLLGLNENCPIESLSARWIIVADKTLAHRKEGEMLKHYVSIHKELPPLNYKYNWSNH